MSAPTTGERVLVVDDEPDIVALVAYHLAKAGYRVSTAANGTEAMDAAREERPALIVLDLMLPEMSGFEVLEKLRADEATRQVAVLMLTARREEPDRIRGLSLGADDYLTKPFSPRTLLARVKALLRRAGMENAAPLAAGRVTLDVDEHTVQVGANPAVRLTQLELRLLQMLIANAGHTVSSDRLLMQVWGHKGSGDRQLLKQLVHRLRHKIEVDPANPQMLQTAPGAGYKLVVE